MTIVFYGSCQLEAIAKMLKFDKNIPTLVILNWKYILQKKELPESLYKCDIFIYQPYTNGHIDNKDYFTSTILEKLPKHVKTISIPFIASNIYWPDAFLDNRNDNTKTDQLQFGKFPQQSCILSKYNTSEEVFSKEHYSPDFLSIHEQNCYAKIANIEKECDIKILDFIKQNIHKHIFHSIQHPNNSILLHSALQIQSLLKVNIVIIDYELLKDHTVFILPDVKKHFNINTSYYKLNGNGIVDEKVYVERYIQYITSK